VGADRHLSGCDGRCGLGRTARLLALCAALALLVAGCGKSGHGASTDPEKASDASILNEALAQELTAVDAYARGLPLLRGRMRAVGRELHAQEEEYVDALTRAIRGVGGRTEAEASKAEAPAPHDQREVLTGLYELESAALAADIAAAPRLYTSAPRSLASSLAAGHAQHLVVLRQGLGASPAASVPEAFDGGEVPPPGGNGPNGGG
jgi:Ferritin-like domain